MWLRRVSLDSVEGGCHFGTTADIQNRAMSFNLLFSLPHNQTGIVVLQVNESKNNFFSRCKGGQSLPFW